MSDDVFTIGRKLDSIIKDKDYNEDNVTDLLKALQSLPMTLDMLEVSHTSVWFAGTFYYSQTSIYLGKDKFTVYWGVTVL